VATILLIAAVGGGVVGGDNFTFTEACRGTTDNVHAHAYRQQRSGDRPRNGSQRLIPSLGTETRSN
jgi:hypothetical protein